MKEYLFKAVARGGSVLCIVFSIVGQAMLSKKAVVLQVLTDQ